MANLTFTSEILDYALFHAGEATDTTSSFEGQILIECNRAYRAILMGGTEFDPAINETWWWLRKTVPGVLTLDPLISSGTANVTNNSATVTMSAAPAPTVDSDTAEWHFRVDGHPDTFRVNSQTTVTLTLDSVYTGATNTAANYKLFKTEYDLASDVIRVMSAMRAYQDGVPKIEGMELDSLERDWPLKDIDAGTPTAFAMIEEQKVRFNKYGGLTATDLIRVDYDYLALPSDLTDSASEEPLIPKQYRHILADAALYFLMQNKNDNRAESIGVRVRSGLRGMARENRAAIHRMGDLSGKLQPRQDQLARIRGPLRTSSGLIIG